jgi:hypothetical protein
MAAAPRQQTQPTCRERRVGLLRGERIIVGMTVNEIRASSKWRNGSPLGVTLSGAVPARRSGGLQLCLGTALRVGSLQGDTSLQQTKVRGGTGDLTANLPRPIVDDVPVTLRRFFPARADALPDRTNRRRESTIMSPRLLSLTIVCAAVPLLGAGAVPTGERQDVFATGPRLDDLPGPRAARTGLPPPAQGPVLRYRHPLRILVLTGKRSLAPLQRIACRMRSTVEFCYAGKNEVRGHC